MTAYLLYSRGDRGTVHGPTLRELLAVAWELGAVRAEVNGVTYERDGLVWVWRPEAGRRAA
jgi:hypothetical protein